jgi:MFS family permease
VTEAVRRYWSVLDSQDVGWLAVGAFVAYVGYAVRSLAVVMLVQQRTGSYVLAGAAVAGTYVGGALMAPLRGRLLDRYGQTRVVAPMAALYFATMTALVAASLLEPVAILLVGLAILGGAAFPAVFASMRSIWATMFRGDPRLTPAYALESVVQDTAMVCGPLVAGVLVAQPWELRSPGRWPRRQGPRGVSRSEAASPAWRWPAQSYTGPRSASMAPSRAASGVR